MRILVTGGTGVVGSATLDELLSNDHRVRLLSRNAEVDAKRWSGVEAFDGDVSDAASIEGAADGCDAVLHIAGVVVDDDALLTSINVGGTRNLVGEAGRAGVKRFVFLSSLGCEEGASSYHRSKREAENIVRESALDWTIVRPGNVYGPGDDVITKLLKLLRTLPALPIIDDGEQPFQPIWHEDLARALSATLARNDLRGQTLDLSGDEVTSMTDLIDRLAAITGRDPIRVPLPAAAVSAVTAVGEAAGFTLPVGTNKLTMLHEHNVISGSNALTDLLHIEPTPLGEGLRMLAQTLPEQLPEEGFGALHHKRFFADIEGAGCTPQSVMNLFRNDGLSIMPVEFGVENSAQSRLVTGATLTGKLPVRGTFQVRVEVATSTRVILATLEGHPLAGIVDVSTEQHGTAIRFAIDVYARAANVLDFIAINTIGAPLQAANWRKTVQGIIDASGGTSPAGVQQESRSLDEAEGEELTKRIRTLIQKRQRDESGSASEHAAQR